MKKVSLDVWKQEELLETVRGFPVLYDKSHKGFKEKDAVKNASDGAPRGLTFLLNNNYFYFDTFNCNFLKTIS